MRGEPITMRRHYPGRVFGGMAQAEWKAANLLEGRVWLVLAICGAAALLAGALRLWGSFWGLAF